MPNQTNARDVKKGSADIQAMTTEEFLRRIFADAAGTKDRQREIVDGVLPGDYTTITIMANTNLFEHAGMRVHQGKDAIL
jgi:hypothetical protein